MPRWHSPAPATQCRADSLNWMPLLLLLMILLVAPVLATLLPWATGCGGPQRAALDTGGGTFGRETEGVAAGWARRLLLLFRVSWNFFRALLA